MTGPSRSSNLSDWIVVAVGFAALSVGFSARSALGLAMPVWEAELGWSRSFVSAVGASALLASAVSSPVAGNAVDRFGPRLILVVGLGLVGLGMLAVAMLDSPLAFALIYGGLAGLGFGVVAVHVVSTVVARRFEANRGLATGAATSGSTAGQLVVVPVLAAVLGTVGWRPSYAVLGLAALALAALAWIVLGPNQVAAGSRMAPRQPLGQRLAELARSPVFLALFGSFVICGFTTAGVIETHLLPYAAACGFPPLPSATAYGVLSALNFVGMILAGWLTDRVHRPLLLGGIYVMRGLSFLLLMQIAGDIRLLFLFAVMFGLFDYATVVVTASLVASHLGLRIMGLAMGVLSAGHAAGAALGAFLGGWLYDLFATYDWVWTAAFALAILAGLMAFTIREYRFAEPAPVPA